MTGVFVCYSMISLVVSIIIESTVLYLLHTDPFWIILMWIYCKCPEFVINEFVMKKKRAHTRHFDSICFGYVG